MLCSTYSFAENEKFLTTLNERIASQRIPLCGSIDLTSACNLRCAHCYISNGSAPDGDELSTEEVLVCIDQLVDAGCLFLLLTGGEPFLRKDFRTVYEHAKRSGLLITLFTNGTLLDEDMADFLGELPPMLVEISLYGASAEVHDSITGLAGSFNDSIRAVDLLRERGIRVDLKSVIMTLNRQEVPDLIALAVDKGARFRVDGALFPRLDGNKKPLEFRLSPSEIVELEFTLKDRANQWKDFVGRIGPLEDSESLYECGAGTSCFHITSGGQLKPCLMTSEPAYDLRSGTFAEGWQVNMAQILDKVPVVDYPCSTCGKRLVCDSCPGFFEMENGSEDICSGFVCAIAEERVKVLQVEQLCCSRHG